MSASRALRAELQEHGIAGPLRVLDVRRAALAMGVLAVELQHQRRRAAAGHPMVLAGWHGWSSWASELATHPVLLRAIESVMGAPCRVWASELWLKTAGSPVHVPWHQDDVFWPQAAELPTISAWVALTEASPANGGLELVRRSHDRRWTHAPVDPTRGGLDHGIDPSEIRADDVWRPCLSPGEAVLFDARIVHGSPPNRSARERVALSLRYTSVQAARRAFPSGLPAAERSTYDQRPPA